MKKKIPILIIFWSLLYCPFTNGQDVEGLINEARSIKQKVKSTFQDTFKMSGGLMASSELNYINGADRRSTPFNYQLNAALNLSMYGFNLPTIFVLNEYRLRLFGNIRCGGY